MSRYVYRDSRYSSHAKILQLAGKPQEQQVECIDIGCASGYVTQLLHRNGWKVLGIDIEPHLQTRDLNVDKKVKFQCLDFMTADISHLKERYDLVVVGDVVEHIFSTQEALARIKSLMKQDGRLIISVPNIVNIHTRISIFLGRFNYQERGPLDNTHVRFFTFKTFRKHLEEAGLREEIATYTGLPLYHYLNPKHRFLTNLLMSVLQSLARLRPSLFAYQFIYVCSKK